MKKSCMSCQKFYTCSIKNKSPTYLCDKYKPKPIIDLGDFSWDRTILGSAEIGTTEIQLPEDAEFHLAAELDTLLDPLTNQPRDLKVDDRDLPEFKNYHDFLTDQRYGLGLAPFSRQLWAMAALFQEICPFCSNPKWLNIEDVPVDGTLDDCRENLVFTNFGKCPKCKKPRTKFEKAFPYRSEFMGLLGQRVGKSTMLVAPSTLYLTHKILKLPKPYMMFGLNPTPLIGTMVAQTYKKAVEQLWLPYKSYMDDCKWFTEFHEIIKDVQNQTGEEIFRVSQTQAYYPHKNVMVYPSGPNKGTLRGNTRFFSAIDEVEFIDTVSGNEEAVKMNAEEVHKSLDRSLATLRAAHEDLYKQGYHSIMNAYGFYVSSPNTARSFLFRSIKSADPAEQTLALHLPTWEVHPKLRRTSKVIQKAFKEDEQKAGRDFGAQPLLGMSNFMESTDLLVSMVDETKTNCVSYVYQKMKSRKANIALERGARITEMRKPWLSKIPPHIMTFDGGYSNNSFSLMLARRDDNPASKSKSIIVSALVEIAPKKGHSVLNYNAIYEKVICPLIKEYNVCAIVADRWNSIKLMDDAHNKFAVHTELYTCKHKDFVLFKSYAESKGFLIPKAEIDKNSIFDSASLTDYPHNFQYKPVAHFIYQCATVQEAGKQVVKGRGSTDDLFRCAVLATTFLLDEVFYKKYFFSVNNSNLSISNGLVATPYMSYSIGGSNQTQNDLDSAAACIGARPTGLRRI